MRAENAGHRARLLEVLAVHPIAHLVRGVGRLELSDTDRDLGRVQAPAARQHLAGSAAKARRLHDLDRRAWLRQLRQEDSLADQVDGIVPVECALEAVTGYGRRLQELTLERRGRDGLVTATSREEHGRETDECQEDRCAKRHDHPWVRYNEPYAPAAPSGKFLTRTDRPQRAMPSSPDPHRTRRCGLLDRARAADGPPPTSPHLTGRNRHHGRGVIVSPGAGLPAVTDRVSRRRSGARQALLGRTPRP